MLQKALLSVALTLALPLSAFAQDSAAPTAPADAQDVVGLAAAIKTAQQKTSGGVLDAELERRDKRLVYEIELARGGTIHQAIVDAHTGQLISTEEQKLEGTWSRWFEKDELQAAESAGDALADSLASAEKAAGTKVTEVSLDKENGRWVYEVELGARDGGTRDDHDLIIEAQSGKVVSGTSVTGSPR